MQFTYTYLKNAEMNNVIVGKYEGYNVLPTTKAHLADNGERDDVIYLLYDDNNLLYRNGKVFAKVSANGRVETFYAKRYEIYRKKEEEKSAFVREKAPAAGDDDTDVSSETSTSGIVADVALGILVEDTLKGARETSIDELLKGFDYGL